MNKWLSVYIIVQTFYIHGVFSCVRWSQLSRPCLSMFSVVSCVGGVYVLIWFITFVKWEISFVGFLIFFCCDLLNGFACLVQYNFDQFLLNYVTSLEKFQINPQKVKHNAENWNLKANEFELFIGPTWTNCQLSLTSLVLYWSRGSENSLMFCEGTHPLILV